MKLFIILAVFASLVSLAYSSSGYKPLLPRTWRRPPSRRFSEESEPVKFDHAKKSSLFEKLYSDGLSSFYPFSKVHSSNIVKRSIDVDESLAGTWSMRRPPLIKKRTKKSTGSDAFRPEQRVPPRLPIFF